MLRSTPLYELRVYSAYVAARTCYDTRPEGLGRLTEYLEGANERQERLPAPQPLVTRYDPLIEGGELLKTMLLAAQPKDGSQAPRPSVEGVELCVAGGEALACRELLGNVTPAVAERARAQLLEVLTLDGLSLDEEDSSGGFRLATYGPLYSLAERRNELWLRVRLAA